DDEKVYCICRRPYDGSEFMIQCEACEEWFHGKCVGVEPKRIKGSWSCSSC
ncbi:hypothetical protein BC832DRAFT_521979, partial [Gaertneriomyces semiglobifer]